MINSIRFILFFGISLTFLDSDLKASSFSGFYSDSLRVKWVDGKKFVLHKVDPKQTWTSVAKKYNISVDDLRSANVGVDDLKTGQIIQVPVVVSVATLPPVPAEKLQEKPLSTPSPAQGKKTALMYTVKQGETLFSIAKRFNQTVDNVKAFNNLTSDTVQPGQKLIVSYITAGSVTIPDPVQPERKSEPEPLKEVYISTEKKAESTPATNVVPAINNSFEKPTKSVSPIKKGAGGKTLIQITETGVASWIRDAQVSPDKFYGLHRTAPIGTIVKITNRMNGHSVFVKIVGTLPDTGDNENIIIKVSQAVSSRLNALDQHFRVELTYGVMQ